MTTITLKGQPIQTFGELPAIGSQASDFILTTSELKEITRDDYAGKKIILSIFPSVDTEVCANSVREFNRKTSQLEDIIVLCVSADLPFALKRFCAAEGLANVVAASVFRHPEFGRSYGVTIQDGPLAGLLSRAIILIDEKNTVLYTEQVPEITHEPNYEQVYDALHIKH